MKKSLLSSDQKAKESQPDKEQGENLCRGPDTRAIKRG
jgi:hypothetical protein